MALFAYDIAYVVTNISTQDYDTDGDGLEIRDEDNFGAPRLREDSYIRDLTLHGMCASGQNIVRGNGHP